MKKKCLLTPTVQAKEWEDVSYYFLPHRMKRVFGLDGKGLVFAGTAFDMEKFISSTLAEAYMFADKYDQKQDYPSEYGVSDSLPADATEFAFYLKAKDTKAFFEANR